MALDVAHDGKVLGEGTAGAGVDGIAYAPGLGHVYAPAAGAATLSILGVGEHGELERLGSIATSADTHCAVADERANVYVCDPREGRLLVLRDPYPPSRPRR